MIFIKRRKKKKDLGYYCGPYNLIRDAEQDRVNALMLKYMRITIALSVTAVIVAVITLLCSVLL